VVQQVGRLVDAGEQLRVRPADGSAAGSAVGKKVSAVLSPNAAAAFTKIS